MKITIYGRTPSKKNSKRLVMIKGRLIPISSKDYMAWHKDALKQVTGGHRMPVAERYRVEVTIYPPDRIKSDLTNKAESIMDLLVDAGVLEDDNWFVCAEVVLKFGGVDKLSPRAEVEISHLT